MKFLIFFMILSSCVLTGKTQSLREAEKYACLAPSINYKSLDALHATKITAFSWAKKYTNQALTREFNIGDKCLHTKLLIKMLYTSQDADIGKWTNKLENTSGQIKIIKTYYGSGSNGLAGCRYYISRLSKDGNQEDRGFIACPNQLGWGILDDSRGFPIPAHLVFAGWYFYDERFFK